MEEVEMRLYKPLERAHLPLLTLCLLSYSTIISSAQTADQILNYTGTDRAEFLTRGANQEKALVLYTALIVNQAVRPLADAFTKLYPFIKVTYLRGDGAELPRRVLAEEQARNVVADVVEGTTSAVTLERAGVLQPFTSPMISAYPEAYRDPNRLWATTRLSYYCAAINTNLVAAGQAPKTFEDLLDPRWKGKIAWRVGVDSGPPLFITNIRSAFGEQKAEDYLKALSGQQVVNFAAGSARTLVDRVIAGEYAIALNIFCHHPLISAAQGAPVAPQLMDPVVATAGNIAMPRGLHHPYAAALFTDFLLSEEGQRILAGAQYYPAHPNVAALKLLAPIVPRIAGFKENFLRPEEEVDEGAISNKLYEQYFR
jgi:ABC-type Fe3+ transport system substrate-binding protein